MPCTLAALVGAAAALALAALAACVWALCQLRRADRALDEWGD